MSRYTIEELITRWKGEALTTEQAVGQILLALEELGQWRRTVERRLAAPPPSSAAPSASAPPPSSATPAKPARPSKRRTRSS